MLSSSCVLPADAGIKAGVGEVLLVKDVCAAIRCGKTKVYELFESGELEGFRIGSGIRIYRISVTNYMTLQANRRLALKPIAEPTPRPTVPKKKPTLLHPPAIGGYGHGL